MDATHAGSAADRVFEHVRHGILNRRYADNDLLAEGDIAQETGVSRTPVREALLRLEAQGMVRLLPKRGALVLPVTAQEWHDLLATRLLVETHCTRAAILAGRGPAVALSLAVPLAELRAAANAHDLAGLRGRGPELPRDHRRRRRQHHPDQALLQPARSAAADGCGEPAGRRRQRRRRQDGHDRRRPRGHRRRDRLGGSRARRAADQRAPARTPTARCAECTHDEPEARRAFRADQSWPAGRS